VGKEGTGRREEGRRSRWRSWSRSWSRSSPQLVRHLPATSCRRLAASLRLQHTGLALVGSSALGCMGGVPPDGAKGTPPMHNQRLPHHKLPAYEVAIRLLEAVRSARTRDCHLRDEAMRAAKSACLNAAEGGGACQSGRQGEGVRDCEGGGRRGRGCGRDRDRGGGRRGTGVRGGARSRRSLRRDDDAADSVAAWAARGSSRERHPRRERFSNGSAAARVIHWTYHVAGVKCPCDSVLRLPRQPGRL